MLLLSLFILSGCERLSKKPASLEEITKVIDALRVGDVSGLKELDVESEEYEAWEVSFVTMARAKTSSWTRASTSFPSVRITSSSGYQLPASDVPTQIVPVGGFVTVRALGEVPLEARNLLMLVLLSVATAPAYGAPVTSAPNSATREGVSGSPVFQLSPRWHFRTATGQCRCSELSRNRKQRRPERRCDHGAYHAA